MKRPSLNYANIMATIAVFVALGGSAYAATQLKKNSVGTKQLKKEAVTAQKIKKGTITGTQVDASTLGTVPAATNASSAASATNASNANTLGGNPASAFEQSANLLSAVVTNDGTASLVRGTGATSVERVGPGDVFVTFRRDVSNCAWVADRGEPGPVAVENGVATVRGVFEKPDVVDVVTYSVSEPDEEQDMDFHLIVLC